MQIVAFSCKLEFAALNVLGFPAKSTVISEAELMALLVGLVLWKKYVRGRPCVCYVDNNATREVAIAGRARTQPGLSLVSELLRLEDSIELIAWYARVPSLRNIAGAPSRNSDGGDSRSVCSLGYVNLVLEKSPVMYQQRLSWGM